MDNKGFISIEYLFSLFIVLIIGLGVLFYASASISSTLNIEDTVTHRIILDEVADVISQVNSNGEGYSKSLKLPSDKGYFEIIADKNSLTMEYDGKKGETMMMYTNLDAKYRLISGKSYYITRTEEGVVIS